MKYLYESHTGGIYTSDRALDYDDLYCEQCADCDRLLGAFETIQEFWDLIKDDCDINGSGGYSLQYIYPIMVEEFDLPYSVEYDNEFHRELGCCCNSTEEIIANIEETINQPATSYLDEAENEINTFFKEYTLPDYFYQCLFGELVKVYGIKYLIPDKNYDAEYDDDGNVLKNNEEDYSYKDQIDYGFTFMEGTGGWHLALKESCKLCGLMSMYEDYCNFDWVKSDYFDDYIENRMIDVLFSDDSAQDYYRFKFKENNYE